jgi:aminoglycoside 3-N-acetyltransferase
MNAINGARALRRAVKARIKRAQLGYLERFHPFDSDDLGRSLRQLGLVDGDHVLVHSSMNRFGGFQGKPSDVIAALTEIVGDTGTVLMPAIPFLGSAVDYVGSKEQFDVRRTPSKMGLLTEIFRRSKGVVVSTHPTHPVVGRGRLASELLADHDKARTPCGIPSPFQKMLEVKGKTVLLGVSIGALTVFHALEEELAPLMPFDPFTAESYSLATIGTDGEKCEIETRLYAKQASRARDLSILQKHLEESGHWRENRVGKMTVTVLDLDSVRNSALALATQGLFCYRGFGGAYGS